MRSIFVLLGVFMVFCLLFMSGCAVDLSLSEIKTNSKTDEELRSKFDQLPLPEKIRSVTQKNYSTCRQIRNFCIENPFLPDCKKSCGEFYPAWNISLDATLKSSVNPVLFAQTLTKESFNEYDDQTKQDIVDERYFSDCEQISDYCLNTKSVKGCPKYCSGFFSKHSYYGDLFNNGSKVIITEVS